MKMSRRGFLRRSVAAAGGCALLRGAAAADPANTRRYHVCLGSKAVEAAPSTIPSFRMIA